MDRRRYVAVSEQQTVVAAAADRLTGKPGPVQTAEQKVATAIARENPPGPVPAMSGRRQSDNQQPSLQIPE